MVVILPREAKALDRALSPRSAENTLTCHSGLLLPRANNTIRSDCLVARLDYAFAASHAARPAALLSPFACTEEKSPRSAFSAYLSTSISRRVRTPLRRKNGTGGHQPCTAC